MQENHCDTDDQAEKKIRFYYALFYRVCFLSILFIFAMVWIKWYNITKGAVA